jgi:hypothetical protein
VVVGLAELDVLLLKFRQIRMPPVDGFDLPQQLRFQFKPFMLEVDS